MEYRERERQRKGESRQQANDAKRRKERQRARARDKKKKNKRRHFLLEKQHENFEVAMRKSEMLAATKVKMSGSEKKSKQTKNKKHNNMYDISSIKRVARNVLEFSLHINSKW